MNNSKRLLQLLLLLALITGSACNRNQTVIRGTIEGGEGTLISLEKLDVNRTIVIDSLTVGKSDAFVFKTRLEHPELFVLRNGQGEIMNLLITPGDDIAIATSDSSFSRGYRVEGSEESENIRMLVEQVYTTRHLLDSLKTAADAVSDPESPQLDLIRSAYTQALVKQKRFTIRYVVGHLTSLSSIYAIYQKYDGDNLIMGMESDLQYFKVLADSLEVSFPNSSLTKSLRADIERREAEFEQTAKLNQLLEHAEIREGLPEISIPDRDGNEISLSSLTGKVVQLMFWASADQTSIETLLGLKQVYNRYRVKGFEIYAISLDNNKIQWMNAIDFNEFNWINVSELNYPESQANRLFNVTSIPTGFLINREGEVMARDLYGRRLETWLDNLL